MDVCMCNFHVYMEVCMGTDETWSPITSATKWI